VDFRGVDGRFSAKTRSPPDQLRFLGNLVTFILILGLVIGFAVLAPHVRQSHGGGALWLLAGGASLSAALAFAFLDEPTPATTGLWVLYFWPALIAAGTGFGALALLIRRRHGRPQAGTTWVDLLLALVVWLLGAAAGGAVAVGTGLLLLSAMAP
jgi:hypothetical protein